MAILVGINESGNGPILGPSVKSALELELSETLLGKLF